MSEVHAQFSLATTGRVSHYTTDESGKSVQVEAVKVEFYGVQGEPFGKYTPTANMSMVIVNPDAAAVFRDAPLGQKFDVIIRPHVDEPVVAQEAQPAA